MSLAITWKGCAPENFARGRKDKKPVAIVIHLMDGTLVGTDAWFSKPPSERYGAGASSAHYGIGRDGSIHQYVDEGDTAYHAGRTYQMRGDLFDLFRGQNPNLRSIGIEHEGFASEEWPEPMYEASARLIADIAKRWEIPMDRAHIVGHKEIYGRKTCPGKCDLEKLVTMAIEVNQ